MDTLNRTAITNVPGSNTICKDYIEFTREPFELDEFDVTLQNGKTYTLDTLEQHLFFKRIGLVIPPLVIDVLFNFNNVRWYPNEQRMEPM